MSKSKEETQEFSRDEINNMGTPKRRQIVSGANYWPFSAQPIFIGKFVSDHYNDEGKLIGYDFVDQDGEMFIISNCYATTKALDTEIDGKIVRDMDLPLEITFLGKVEMKNGKPFNRYSVVLLG